LRVTKKKEKEESWKKSHLVANVEARTALAKGLERLLIPPVQGYLTHKKPPRLMTIQQAYS
jgi:hypothetical protein